MADKMPAFIQKPKAFLQETINTIKGPGAEGLIEKYTSEMTTVAEGLWVDQQRLRQELADVAAQQTIIEKQDADLHASVAEELHSLDTRVKEMNKRLQSMEGKQQKLGKRSRVLGQVTVIVAIASGAWVLVTLVNALIR